MLGPELFLAINAMRAAYSGIQYCCEALSEGTVQVQKIKKAAENAQQIVKDAKSVWSILKGLFGGKPAASPPAPTPATVAPAEPGAKKKPKPKDEYITHIPTEDEIVQQFIGHVAEFYRTHAAITDGVEKGLAAEYARDKPDPHAILQLSAYKHELDQSYMKLSGMMRGAHVPKQLGPLWDNFHAIYGQVSDEQQARKERERIKRNNDSWLQKQTHDFLVDRFLAAALVLGLTLWAWALMWSLGWPGLTPPGFE